jgi:hypothetical protein
MNLIINNFNVKLTKRQEEITKLREELKALEINTKNQLKEKSSAVEQLNNELIIKNQKVCILQGLIYFKNEIILNIH